MARPLRIEYPGAFYHVTSRGNNSKNIFESDSDREKFLSYIEAAFIRYNSRIYCYCLMSNHYHLLIETPLANLSEIMRYINGSYTAYFNIKRKSNGHLFQGRYKAILVDRNSYAIELSRYLHLNPIRAKMTNDSLEYKWSSYQHYTTNGRAPDWLSTDFILGFFGRHNKSSKQKYKIFVESLSDKDYDSPLKNAVASTILGDQDFVREIKEKYLTDKKEGRDIPALRELNKKSVEMITSQVNLGSISEKLARKISIYLSHQYSGRSLREIGNYFGISESAVTQTSRRFKLKLEDDKELKKTAEKIIGDLDNV